MDLISDRIFNILRKILTRRGLAVGKYSAIKSLYGRVHNLFGHFIKDTLIGSILIEYMIYK